MQPLLEVQGFVPPVEGGAPQPCALPPKLKIQRKAKLTVDDVDAESIFGWLSQAANSTTPPGRLEDVLRIHEYERQRLGQELHDSAGQLLIALELSILHLKRVEKDCDHANLIDEIQDSARRIDQEIRSLAFLHYPVELGGRSLSLAAQSLALGFGRRTGIHTTFKWAGDNASIDDAVSMAVLRVVQEALVNIHRHSHASVVKVAIHRTLDRLDLTISDNGVGFPPVSRLENTHGIGLQGMRHRVETLGGRFRLANLKQGARISLSVPVFTAGSAGF